MSDEQATKNVELVSRALLDAASHLRTKALTAMTDDRFSDADRIEISAGIDEAIRQLEVRAQWWKTGEGPAP